MTAEELQFLLAEYNQAWSLVNAIDERRGKFLQSITTVVVATVGAIGFLISTETPTLPFTRAVEACALAAITIVGCFAVVSILLAERRANVRYRKKANVIRQLLLASSTTPAIQNYLSANKHLGILLPGDTEEPHGVGRTLRAMLIFLALQMLGLIATLAYVVARYNGCVAG